MVNVQINKLQELILIKMISITIGYIFAITNIRMQAFRDSICYLMRIVSNLRKYTINNNTILILYMSSFKFLYKIHISQL